MTLTPAKKENLKKLSTANGIIAAAAMDQRGSLQKSIAKEKGVEPEKITHQMMSEFKTIVTQVLSPYASAMLLDPEFGLEGAKTRPASCGLLLAYEKSGYDNTSTGRMPLLLEDWSPEKIKKAGANAVKILLYYTPFEEASVNKQKHDWVEQIGKDCTTADIPFFLEFVGYNPQTGDDKSLAFAKIKPDVVTKSMIEFSKPKYGVDVLKIEIPVNLSYTSETKSFKGGEAAYTKKEALQHYRNAAKATHLPFIYLSAGVSENQFRESLELAIEAGVKFNGILCGRATWKDGIPVYAKQGGAALEAWLRDKGVANIQALNSILERGATPWW